MSFFKLIADFIYYPFVFIKKERKKGKELIQIIPSISSELVLSPTLFLNILTPPTIIHDTKKVRSRNVSMKDATIHQNKQTKEGGNEGMITLSGRLCGWLRDLLDGADQRAHGRRCYGLLVAGGPFPDHPGRLPSEASVAAGVGGRAAWRRFFLSCGHCKGFATSPNPP